MTRAAARASSGQQRGAAVALDVAAELRALDARVEALETRLARRYGARDEHDRTVVRVLAAQIGRRPFRASDALRHAAVDSILHAALTAADLTTARELGMLLQRAEQTPVDGFLVQRVETRRRPARQWWTVQPVSTPEDAQRLAP